MHEPFSSLSGFSIERLITFCRVAEHGSIKDAADADPTRQSQYSRQIKDLENSLGLTLFDRSGKKWVVTDQGRRLVVIARGFFQSVASLQAEGIAARQRIRIGSGDGILVWYVAPRLERVRQLSPRISFECRILRTNEIIRQLKEGEIDIGIVREETVDDGLISLPFLSVDYSFFVPRSLLPGKSAAGFELLRELPMAKLSGHGSFQRQVDILLNQLGIAPRIWFEAGSFMLLVHAMSRMSLAAVLPAASKDEFSEELFATIQIDSLVRLRRELVIATNPELVASNPNVESIARLIQNAG